MWRRRDFLRSGIVGLALGLASGRVEGGILARPLAPIGLDEAAEVLGTVGAHGGALDALLHDRRELYAVARDQLRAAHDALISISMPASAEGARPAAERAAQRLALRRLAAAAVLHADRLDQVIQSGAPGAVNDQLTDPATDRHARRVAAAARLWCRTCSGPRAEIQTVLAGPLACALETARFSLRRDAAWERSVLEFYATRFEDSLGGNSAEAGLEPGSDRTVLAAAARARAATAEALGLVRSAMGEDRTRLSGAWEV